MKVARDNVWARVIAWHDPQEGVWLSRMLTYACRSSGRMGRGKVVVFDGVNDRFPAGLLPDVLTAARAEGMQVQVFDERPPPPTRQHDVDLGWLDDHQRTAVDACGRFLRGIIKYPTGGGKTEIAIACMLAFPGVRWGFFAPREQLAEQARARWAARTDGAPCGAFMAGQRDLSHRVTFATFQSVSKALGTDPAVRAWLHSLGGLFADEAQTCAAKTFLPVLTECTNARMRFGLSATPLDRSDDRAVFTLGSLGPVILEVRPDALVATGRIVPAAVTMLRVSQCASTARDRAPGRACPACTATGNEPCDPLCTADDIDAAAAYAAAYDELVVNSTLRNTLLVRAILAAPRPGLVVVKRRKHGKTLQALLAKATGRKVPFVDQGMPDAARDAVAKGLDDGTHPLAVASMVWEAGVDIPELRTIANGAGGRSVGRTVQVLGRGVRAVAGKAGCVVIDVADEGEPVLQRHARIRAATYAREGWTVTYDPPGPAR